MSPVSKKRKPKKHKPKRQAPPGAAIGVPPRQRTGAFAIFNPNPFHESWFAAESRAVLESAEREWESWYDEELPGLEHRASQVVGAVLLRRWKSDHSTGNSFNPWLGHLAKAAANRVAELARTGDDAWRGPACLLLGLAAIRPSGLKGQVDTAVVKLRKALDRSTEVLDRLGEERTEPTGRAWVAVDAYGDRYGLVIETRTSIDEQDDYYLVAVEMAANNTATYAGSFATLDHALDRWREHVGPSAADSLPKPVASGADLWFLMYLNDPGDISYELNMLSILKEYFRAQRRLEDLVSNFRARGLEPPAPVSLLHPDVEPDFEPFMAWLAERGWDEDAVGERVYWLINEWLTDAASPTVHAVSPLRIASRSLMLLEIYDMGDDFKALMTEWIRYCAIQTGLADDLAVAAIASIPANSTEALKFEGAFELPNDE